MMKTLNHVWQNQQLKRLAFFLFLSTTLSLRLVAQNINDFKIFVAADTVSHLKFNDKVADWEFKEENGFSNYDVSLSDDYTLQLTAKKATVEMMHLIVTEGKRTHRFIVLYQEGVTGFEADHDYSNLDKLAKLVKDAKEGNSTDTKIAGLLAMADKAFQEGRLEAAAEKYKAVLQIDPDNSAAKKQLALADARLDENTRAVQKNAEEAFNALVQKANNLYIGKSYEAALAAYLEAQQARPADEYVKSQVTVVTKKMEDQKLAEAGNRKDSLFNSCIISADKAVNENRYDDAINMYNQALVVRPGDLLTTEKLKKTDEMKMNFAQREESKKTEALYKSYIDAADKAYLEKSFEEAKLAYLKAFNIKDNDKYAGEQLKKINDVLAIADEQRIKEEKNREAAEAYNLIIRYADSTFNLQMWEIAKDAYKKALGIKFDQHIQLRLTEIENILATTAINDKARKDSLSKENEANKKYNILIAKAKIAYINNEYVAAQQAYTEAAELKPAEEEPAKMLADITGKLAAMMQAKDIQDKYDSLTAKASFAIANNDYQAAKLLYQDALLVNPEQAYYLQKQIAFLQRQIAVKDSVIMEERKEDEVRQKFKEGMDAYNKSRDFLKKANYPDALSELKKFLSLIPNTVGLNTNQYNQQGLIDYAKGKVKDLEEYLERQKKDSTNKADIPVQKQVAIDTAGQRSSGFILQTPARNNRKSNGSKETTATYNFIAVVQMRPCPLQHSARRNSVMLAMYGG